VIILIYSYIHLLKWKYQGAESGFGPTIDFIYENESVMKGLLFVLMAGVALGILIAPDKGSETLSKLKDSLDDVKKKTMDEIDSLVSKGKDFASKAKGATKNGAKAW
jgi:gas vesicle protein